ncbi:MAG: phosphate ABC transporter substrate-binding protein PstS [Vulcanimicrobiaceae bacterium]
MRKLALTALALALTAGCASQTTTTTATATATEVSGRLLETGSTLLYPLMNLWVASYQKQHAGVQITTQGTGSGTGISQAIAGVAQIGASDAYMSDAQMKGTPMLNIPLAISAQQINYNVPGLNGVHLRLSGPVLAGIYSGKILTWNDPAIVGINPRYASKLPHHTIVPIHRSDGSGDTFIFSQYLSYSTPSWAQGPGMGTTISWPAVASGVGANGNPGMVETCKNTPYSIAYIGVSFLDQTQAAHLGYAALRNRAGAFVLPAHATIAAAAQAMVNKTPKDERISLVFAPGKQSYPIINYEYAIVNPHQTGAAARANLVAFLSWAILPNGGNASRFLDEVHFLPLPPSIVKLSKEQIAKIH